MRRGSTAPVGSANTSAAELEVEMLPAAPEPPPEVLAPSDAPSNGAARVAHAASPVHRLSGPSGGEAADGSAVATAEGDEPAAAAAPAPDAASPGPRLSLSQLGVGDSNPFYERGAPAAARAEKAARVQRRLDRALAQGLHDQDLARGRGAGSPVMRSLEAAVYASTAPLNGDAHFIFVIDSEGQLLSSTLGAASGDREAWARVARKAAQSLAQRKLTVPKGKSVRLTVAVTSHLELPSGADPGVAVDVLGIPIKSGAGPRSAKVDLLNPRNPLAPLSLAGDPADIGQKARRMVHAHVVSEELL